MESLGKLNSAIYRNSQSLITSKLKDLDIMSGQCDFLYVIYLNEGISQKELSNYLYIGKSTTAKAIKYLLEKNYIYRQKDELDSRLDKLFVSKEGEVIAKKIGNIFKENLKVASQGLSKSEQEQVLVLMHKVLKNYQKENEKYAK